MSTHKKIHRKIEFFLAFLAIGLLASCATKISHPIDQIIDKIPALNLVRQNIDAYILHRIRWGGVIASVINEKESTVLEIVEHPLNKQGRPLETDQTQGRFLARLNGFLDPVVYAKGREITIVGTIKKQTKRLINQFEYTYPEVTVDSFKLWQIEKQIEYYYDPYWYGQWYPHYKWPRHYDSWLYH